MWLTDYRDCIEDLLKVFGNGCYESIMVNCVGDFIIEPTNPQYFYYYYRKSGRIEKRFEDTWKNPNHIEIIREGR